MKKILLFTMLCFSLFVSAQEQIEVVSFKQSSSDISARTNQRDDTKGIPCALVKVQFPMRDVLFEGNIAGEISFKTNEYWVYMPENSSRLEVKASGCKPLVVDFVKHGIAFVESKGTYELCLLKKEKNASQLYNDGMVALAKNDIVTAFDNLQKASDSGYAPATYQLGATSIVPFDRNYDEDPNTQESYQEAYNYFVKAAETGYSDAQVALGKLLLDYKNEYPEELSKINVDAKYTDSKIIWSFIKDAANQGNTDAQWLMISDEQWCKENANKGVAIAQFGMGLRFDDVLTTEEYPMIEAEISPTEDHATAASWYQKAANNGLDVAEWRLGDLYAQGLGINKDINKAIELKTKAAEQGNFLFQYMMGIMYAYGEIGNYEIYSMFNTELGESTWDSFPQDVEKASYWLRKFNHKEFSKSELSNIINCNGLYSSTLDVLTEALKSKGKYEEAIYWYQREIEMGYQDANCNLGEIYLKGSGVRKDFEKARKMFESAILDDEHYGDGYSGQLKSEALCFLGIIYRDGLGVDVNKEKAKEFFMASIKEKEFNCMALYELGNLCYDESKYEDALRYYKGARSNSFDRTLDGKYVWLNEYSTKACYKLAHLYDAGLGVDKNTDKAIEYMKEAASRGSDEANKYLQERNIPIPSLKLGSSAND